jgi:hypothetical protein
VFPGRLPEVFTVPPRLRYFTGRQPLLDQIRTALAAAEGGRVQVSALQGMGGVGKSQLAIEYAHRHAADYTLIHWIDAGQDAAVPAGLAALTGPLGLSTTGQILDDAAAVLAALRRRSGWLLVYDNAENPVTLRPWLTDGPGHTLITSRHGGWNALAELVEVDVMSRADAIALLGRRVPGLSTDLADQVAALLGDLPLALEQAAAYLTTTQTPPAVYLRRLQTEQARMIAKGVDLAHGSTIDTLWTVTLRRLRRDDPAAVRLLELCAFLGPDPIPLALLRQRASWARCLWRRDWNGLNGDTLDDALDACVAYSLARRTAETVSVHRLVAAVIRARQTPRAARSTASTVRRVLSVALASADPANPAGWSQWAPLVAHVSTAPALHPDNPAKPLDGTSRRLIQGAGVYWRARGDHQSAVILDRKLLNRDRRALGEDHPVTLTTANSLALGLSGLGEMGEARKFNEDTHARRRRVLGDNHFQTLVSRDSV